MTRDIRTLSQRPLDLLVVGGGVHGLFAAYDAAARGLVVGLVDAQDFGSGLSQNHQRTLHGGLRFIERGRLFKARQQIQERRAWAAIAPHLIRPLPFLVGTYRFTKRSPLFLRAGLALYDFAGRSRNNGIASELHLPKARLESAALTRRLSSGIDEAGLSGGAIWYDYQTRHPDRLTWTIALAGHNAGAVLVNYANVIGALRDGTRVAGARIRDEISGEERDVPARMTLLAAGAGLGPLMTMFGVAGAPPLVRAMNFLIDRPSRDIATAARAPSGRMLTLVPWQGLQLVGTHQSSTFVGPGEGRPPAAEVEDFLSQVRATFPALGVTGADVRMVHHGLVPGATRHGRADLLDEPTVIRHSRAGAAGLMTLVGVKYTTARLAASAAIDAVCRELDHAGPRSRTAFTTLPHAGIADVEGRLIEALRTARVELDRDVVLHLADWYGTEATEVARYAIARGDLSRLVEGRPLLRAEFAYAAEQAAAVRLSDAVRRRTLLGATGHPGRQALERAAGAMAPVLGWSPERQMSEIAAVDALFTMTTGDATSLQTP